MEWFSRNMIEHNSLASLMFCLLNTRHKYQVVDHTVDLTAAFECDVALEWYHM